MAGHSNERYLAWRLEGSGGRVGIKHDLIFFLEPIKELLRNFRDAHLLDSDQWDIPETSYKCIGKCMKIGFLAPPDALCTCVQL